MHKLLIAAADHALPQTDEKKKRAFRFSPLR